MRAAIAQNNFTLGESLLQRYQAGQGVTPETIEALSWLGRGALASKQLDRADAYAAYDDAVTFTINKARQIIDLQGERMFEQSRG